MTFIAIEGVIGVGKTTLARHLQGALAATLILEVFEENPFLSAFYQDRDRYAFQTQLFFLLSRYQQMQALAEAPQPIVSDYMFAKDALFARQNLRGDELMVYERVYNALDANTLEPDLIVYLRADTPTLMRRIEIRDRPYERDMDRAYIDGLRTAYEQFFAAYPAERVLRIDTNPLNLVDNPEHLKDVQGRLRAALGQIPQQQLLPGLGRPFSTQFAMPADTPSPSRDLDQSATSADVLDALFDLQAAMNALTQAIRHIRDAELPLHGPTLHTIQAQYQQMLLHAAHLGQTLALEKGVPHQQDLTSS